MARTVNHTVTENEDWIIEATLSDGDGTALNLTDAQAISYEATARHGIRLGVVASLANGMVTVVSAVAGTILIDIPVASHSTLTPKVYGHVCRATLADGTVTDQFTGDLIVEPSP